MSALAALLIRDMRIAVRVGGGALIGVLVFVVVVTLVPFAVSAPVTVVVPEPFTVVIAAAARGDAPSRVSVATQSKAHARSAVPDSHGTRRVSAPRRSASQARVPKSFLIKTATS